jgi:hypothetical protein
VTIFFFTQLWKLPDVFNFDIFKSLWAHKTSLKLEVPVPSQEREKLCTCVLQVAILPVSLLSD